MRRTLYTILTITVTLMIALASPVFAQETFDCDEYLGVFPEIRQMFTAEDNGLYFEIWTEEEIFCACVEILYNEPEDAWLHERAALGAMVIISRTSDERVVDILIDQIDKYPAQALFNLYQWPTVDSVNALAANVGNENFEARENAAEGLRNMVVPFGDVEDGWADALQNAIDEVSEMITLEQDQDILGYFLDAHANLENLLEKAEAASGTN